MLWKNHAKNVHEKLVPGPFLILVNNPKQQLHARNFLEIKYVEEDYQKALRKLTLFFLSNPVHFNGQNYQKRGLELLFSCSSGY